MKKQTDKQLMERAAELTTQRDNSQKREEELKQELYRRNGMLTEKDAIIESCNNIIYNLGLEAAEHSGRLPHFAVVCFMLVSLAAGLYVGHKITQRGQPQKCALVHEGSIITNRVDTFMVGEVWEVPCCLTNHTVMPKGEVIVTFTGEHPQLTIIQRAYQPIVHMKGAERLRK